MISIDKLTVRYGRRTALHDVKLHLATGIVGLLGPNGAGKSTLLSVLATVRRPSSGSVIVGDQSLGSREGRRATREVVGWLPQRFDLAGGMSVLDTVAYAAWCHGVSSDAALNAATEALSIVDLVDLAGDRVRRLSGGQRQRLGLAAAIAHRPTILLLDEPTAGLDPAQRVRFRAYIRHVGRGRTVLLATHLLEDVQHVCERVVVLSQGRVLFCGSSQEMAELGAQSTGEESQLELGYLRLVRDGVPFSL